MSLRDLPPDCLDACPLTNTPYVLLRPTEEEQEEQEQEVEEKFLTRTESRFAGVKFEWLKS